MADAYGVVTQRARSEDVAFRAAFELALDAMLILDDRGCYVEVNAAAAELFGRTRDELLAGSVFDLVLDPDVSRRAWQVFLVEGTTSQEFPMRRPDGAIRIVQYSARAHIGPGRHLVIARDVTREREAAAELRRSEELFATAFRASPVAVAIVDFNDSRLIDMNEAALAYCGCAREEIIGRTTLELGLWVDPAERLRIREELRTHRVLHDVPVQMRRKNGEIRHGVMSVEHVIVAGAPCMLTVITDVTDKRETERLLEEAQSIGHVGSWSVDLRTGAVRWSDETARILGWTGRPPTYAGYLARVHPDDVHVIDETFSQMLRDGAASFADYRYIRPDGELRWISSSAKVHTDATGTPVRASGSMQDITERHEFAASLREAEQNLRQVQKMEAIGALAGGIAHDFNNILSVVLSSATLIQEAVDPEDPIVEDARAIQEAAERAATLTRQLLAFSRRQVLAPRVVNLDKVIAGMEKMLRRVLRERIDLVITSGRPASVLIDPGQFEQVILNLVVNARDAMPDGGELVIDSETVTLPEGAFVRVRVSDNGIGMDEPTRARMFEPFFTTKDKGKGTGLGLAMVFGIIRQSGGFVRVDSTPGKGTAIELYVPLTDRRDAPAKTQPLPLSTEAHGETILVVEDEEPVRKLVQKLLRRHGYHVIAAANAGEALLIAEQAPAIDLLLTDVVMPIMNGRQLAERLRTSYPALRIVFMSGYHDDEVLRDMVDARDVAYLQKPVPRDLMLRRIRDMLDRRC